jgi:replicative DNA helicase
MSDIERQIPHSLEAERGVLGCIFLDPAESMAECMERIRPGKDAFYDIRHQVIYENLAEMYDKKEAIDILTVQQRLKDKQQIDAVGGIAYLAPLPDVVPSASNISFYINTVLDKYVMRKVLETCSDFASKAYEWDNNCDKFLEEFEVDAMKIRDSVVSNSSFIVKELVKQRLSRYEECAENPGKLLGLPTGYPDLDRMIDGMKGGEMIVLAARPSMGKTSLAINIAENVAIDQQIPVGIFSLEMSAESLVGRMISSRGRVNERHLTRGISTEHERKNTFTGAMKVAKAPIHIDDTAGITIGQLKAKARRMKQRNGVRLLVIDYVQLLRVAKSRGNRQEEIAEISTGIKAIAKELNIPVIAICQLNRELERDKERKPRCSDLRESGQIEQDADVIGMLYAADPAAAAQNPDVLAVNLLIAKQRNGPTGDVNLIFYKQFTRFESASKFEPEK